MQNINASGSDEGEIDFVKSSPEKTKIVLENEFVRVIEYSLKPGEKDNPHTPSSKDIVCYFRGHTSGSFRK